MLKKVKVKVVNTNQEFEIDEGVELSKQLDSTNSPILFGCRTGICGTCLLNVEEGKENCNDIGEDETELLEIISEEPNARLGCLIKCSGNIKVKYIGK
jgi:ferredoxin